MINITKHGREYKAPAPPIYYSCTCKYCGCEFVFSDRDTDWTYERTTSYGKPMYFINCPECKERNNETNWVSRTEDK